MNGIKHWLLQLFIAIDQLLNVLVTPGHEGTWADETLSCRAYRMHRDGKPWGRFWMPIINFIFSWQTLSEGATGHCHDAYLSEQTRFSLPTEMR